MDSFGFRQRSFCMRQVSFPRSSTHSSTRSHMRWLTEAFYKNGGVCLHVRIVEAIERLYPDRLSEHVELLAHHASRGELWEKAVDYLHQAGKKAAARSAFRRRWRTSSRRWRLSVICPKVTKTLEQAINIRVDLGPALIATKGFGATEVEETYTRARELCEQLGRRLSSFPCCGDWQGCTIFAGELQVGRELGRATSRH